MLARVKQDYAAGPVRAFSGREYVREEWREVPAGFEEQALTNPLLETQSSLDEIRAESSLLPGLGNPESDEQQQPVDAVTAVTDEPDAETQAPAPATETAEPSADDVPVDKVPAEEPSAPTDESSESAVEEAPPAETLQPKEPAKTTRRRGGR
jgi:hypothetical protein